MEDFFAIILLALVVIICSLIAIVNTIKRRQKGKGSSASAEEDMEALRQQGIISEEEFESIKEGGQQPQQFAVESCTISGEEMREAIEAALQPVSELEDDRSYTGDARWAEAYGIHSEIGFSLKEAALLSMKMVRPRKAIDLIAEVLAMNISIDALEAAQNRGKAAFPNYKVIARIVWVKTREFLTNLISIQKERYERQRPSAHSLLAELVPMTMKSLKMPTTAAGFAVILVLILAKSELDVFLHEDEDKGKAETGDSQLPPG